VTADSFRPELRWAIDAAQDKKAEAITLLDLSGLGAFTEAFLLCTGFSTPQVEAISDAVEDKLREHGIRPLHREGRRGTEWMLLDYGRFMLHVFTERQRLYYDLERLWRTGRRIDVSEPNPAISGTFTPSANDQPSLKRSTGA
jgi:ribosome-associated protein